MGAGVVLRDVVKAFGDVMVIPELNLSVDEGEFVVLVGPSGCGKSTTLRMVAGLEKVTEGSISIAGRDVTWERPKQRDIAMVFQSYALYPHMNVAGNMSFALRLAGVNKSEIQERVMRAAEMLELVPYLERKPRDLSGGQRQRVAMGRAVVRDAYCFLFDEPLSNLDAKLRASMRTELSLLHQKLARTMIYVTHDQIEAMTMADRIVIMKDGLVQQVGTPKDVYNEPVNTFVATFIGSPSMTLLDATFESEGDRVSVAGQGFKLPLPDRLRARANGAGDRKIKVGLRPEHFAGESLGDTFAPIDLTVKVSEYIGSSQFLAARVADADVIAAIEVGPEADLLSDGTYYFDTRRIYMFDQETGEAL